MGKIIGYSIYCILFIALVFVVVHLIMTSEMARLTFVWIGAALLVTFLVYLANYLINKD